MPPTLPRRPPWHRRAASPSRSLLALIVLGLAWELWLAPTGRGTLALKVLPLLLPLRRPAAATACTPTAG